MSDVDARRSFKNKQLITEKAVLTEFLQLYKSFPCLWDQKHMLYSNKEARQNAYEVMLEKYKLIEEDAVVQDVRKRIEYMRCAYRREHKKVIVAKLRGEDHKPLLWYYNLLAFLNDPSLQLMDASCDDSFQIQETHEIQDSDEDEPKPKKNKTSPSNNAIYLTEQHSDQLSLHEGLFEPSRDPPCASEEAEAFGRTVGYQLREVTHEQRIYAEKLISDVIFQARLGKLNSGTTIYLNDD